MPSRCDAGAPRQGCNTAILSLVLWLVVTPALSACPVAAGNLRAKGDASATPVNSLALAPGDEHWDDAFGLPGVDGAVQTLAVDGTLLYAGGSFDEAGGVPAKGIARWDGVAWTELGGGVTHGSSSAGEVQAIAVIGNDVYVAGYFDWAGNVSARNIARWDGSAWHAVGSGVTHWGSEGQVYALATSGPDLYVGGRFDQAGPVAANNIARWDGSSWPALGSGITGGNLAAVYTLATSGSTVCAGGAFTVAGGTSAANVARWDGSAWSALGAGLSGGYTTPVYALLRDPVARAWSALGSGLDHDAMALAMRSGSGSASPSPRLPPPWRPGAALT